MTPAMTQGLMQKVGWRFWWAGPTKRFTHPGLYIWAWESNHRILPVPPERCEGEIIPAGISWQRPQQNGGRWCIHLRCGLRRLSVGFWKLRVWVETELDPGWNPFDREVRFRYTYRWFWRYVRMNAANDLTGRRDFQN